MDSLFHQGSISTKNFLKKNSATLEEFNMDLRLLRFPEYQMDTKKFCNIN